MSCLLYANDEETQKQIDINELYEKDNRRNQRLLANFNKVLNRIHKRIYNVSRSKHNDKHIFFTVPEFLLGEPYYDKGHCIAYLFAKLQENKFHVKYLHPNTLYVSWHHFVPLYIREELKRKTGIVMDDLGNVVHDPQSAANTSIETEEPSTSKNKNAKYKSTDHYKPTGKFVYNSELFDKIEKKVRFPSADD